MNKEQAEKFLKEVKEELETHRKEHDLSIHDIYIEDMFNLVENRGKHFRVIIELLTGYILSFQIDCIKDIFYMQDFGIQIDYSKKVLRIEFI